MKKLLSVFAVCVLSFAGCTDSPPPAATASSPPPAVPTPVVPPLETIPQVAQNDEVPIVPAADAEPQPPPESAESVQPRRVIGKTTSDIRDAEKEEAKGAVRVQPRVTGMDPVTVSGSAYNTIISIAAQSHIKKAVDLFHAMEGRYPKNRDEFMREIIKKNHIELPVLPFYQEYGYDEKTHRLVILEYPDKKALRDGN